MSRIFCYNSFKQKDILKSRGYSYEAAIYAWTRVIDIQSVISEKEFLRKIGLNENDIIVKTSEVIDDESSKTGTSNVVYIKKKGGKKC